MVDNKRIKRYMKMIVDNHIDSGGEINLTTLAEAACDHFDDYLDDGNYTIPDEYYELSFELSVDLNDEAETIIYGRVL